MTRPTARGCASKKRSLCDHIVLQYTKYVATCVAHSLQKYQMGSREVGREVCSPYQQGVLCVTQPFVTPDS